MDAKELAGGFDYDSPDHLFADIKRKREIRNLENSFMAFIEGAWHLIEPSTPYSRNWTTEAIGLHLEATLDGTIRNLLINIPPRMMKSLLVNVFFCAWVWTKDPSKQFIFSSYAENLAIRDSIKCRTIVESDWYRSRWSNVTIRKDQNTKKEWVLSQGGHRIITSVGSAATGKGGHFVICFPYNVEIDTDKGKMLIGDIVNNQHDVLVKSYNHSTGNSEYNKIIGYMDNGLAPEDLIEITFGDDNTLVCTPNHPVWSYTRGRYVRADELTRFDEVICG